MLAMRLTKVRTLLNLSRAADSDIVAGRYAAAKMNLARAYDITSMIPDPTLKLGMILRRAKLAQLTGQFKEEVSWYDMALGILKDNAPLPMEIGSSSNKEKREAYLNIIKSYSQEFGSKAKAQAAQGAKVGFEESPEFTLWNSVVSSRIIALLRLGHVDEAIAAATNLIPSFARAGNWHGLFCLHALKGTALMMKDQPRFPVTTPEEDDDAFALVESLVAAANASPPASVSNLINLLTLPQEPVSPKRRLASDPSREIPLPALLPPEITEQLSPHATQALRSFTKALVIAINSFANQAADSSLPQGYNTATLDALMHLQTFFNVYADSHDLPELAGYAITVAKQAQAVADAVFPVPPPSQQPQASNEKLEEGPGTSNQGLVVPNVAPASPVHIAWCGPRLPSVNLTLLLNSSTTSSSIFGSVEPIVQCLKTVERHLPGDTLYLARALSALARSLEKIDPVAAEGLYRSALSHLEKMPAVFEAKATWVDAQVDYAHLLALMSWNGRSRESEAVRALRKVQAAMEENPLLHPRHRDFEFIEHRLRQLDEDAKKEADEVLSVLKAEERERQLRAAAHGANSEASKPESTSGLKLTSVKKGEAAASQQQPQQASQQDHNHDHDHDSALESRIIQWSRIHSTPLEYWIIERYSR